VTGQAGSFGRPLSAADLTPAFETPRKPFLLDFIFAARLLSPETNWFELRFERSASFELHPFL
jgi:hypothetical protein